MDRLANLQDPQLDDNQFTRFKNLAVTYGNTRLIIRDLVAIERNAALLDNPSDVTTAPELAGLFHQLNKPNLTSRHVQLFGHICEILFRELLLEFIARMISRRIPVVLRDDGASQRFLRLH